MPMLTPEDQAIEDSRKKREEKMRIAIACVVTVLLFAFVMAVVEGLMSYFGE